MTYGIEPALTSCKVKNLVGVCNMKTGVLSHLSHSSSSLSSMKGFRGVCSLQRTLLKGAKVKCLSVEFSSIVGMVGYGLRSW